MAIVIRCGGWMVMSAFHHPTPWYLNCRREKPLIVVVLPGCAYTSRLYVYEYQDPLHRFVCLNVLPFCHSLTISSWFTNCFKTNDAIHGNMEDFSISSIDRIVWTLRLVSKRIVCLRLQLTALLLCVSWGNGYGGSSSKATIETHLFPLWTVWTGKSEDSRS